MRHIVSGSVDLVDLIEPERLTVMRLSVAYRHEWTRGLDRRGRELPDCWLLVIISSERAPPDRLAMWRQLNVRLMNCYGLSEITVTSAFFRLDPASRWDSANRCRRPICACWASRLQPTAAWRVRRTRCWWPSSRVR